MRHTHVVMIDKNLDKGVAVLHNVTPLVSPKEQVFLRHKCHRHGKDGMLSYQPCAEEIEALESGKLVQTSVCCRDCGCIVPISLLKERAAS